MTLPRWTFQTPSMIMASILKMAASPGYFPSQIDLEVYILNGVLSFGLLHFACIDVSTPSIDRSPACIDDFNRSRWFTFDSRCQVINRKIFSDPSVQSDMKHRPFKVVLGADDEPMIGLTYKGEEKQLSAEEFSSMVFIKTKEIAEAYLRCHLETEWVQIWIYGVKPPRKPLCCS